jgi:type I restriction enzyme S subunit
MNNVPKLRFKEFSGEWETKKLEQLSSKISDGIHSTPEYNEDGDYYFVNGNNLKNGVIILDENTKKVTKEEYLKHYRELTNQTILMSINGTIGNLAFYNEEKIMLGKSACYININSTLTNKFFISNQLASSKIQYYYTSKLTGSTIKNLSLKTIKNTPIQLPSKQEQEKIASFLTSVDTKIEQLTKKEELLKQYKKGVMQQIFSQEIRFKADDGSEFEDWVEKKLGDVGEFKSGSGFPEKEQGGTIGTPFYKVSDMNLPLNTVIMTEANNYVTDEQIKKMKLKPIKETSIIFAKVGAAIFLERKRLAKDFILDNNMMAFTPKGNIDFLYQWINRVRLSKFAQVGALPSYNASDLKTIKLSFPCLEEQTKIANFLSSIDNKIDLTQKQLDSTKEFKKALLQQMFI